MYNSYVVLVSCVQVGRATAMQRPRCGDQSVAFCIYHQLKTLRYTVSPFKTLVRRIESRHG